jgi:hypothetical protein
MGGRGWLPVYRSGEALLRLLTSLLLLRLMLRE